MAARTEEMLALEDERIARLRARIALLEARTVELELSEQELASEIFEARLRLAEAQARSSELTYVNDELRSQGQHQNAIFRSLPTPVLELDSAGVIRTSNLAASQLLGHTASFLRGLELSGFIDEADRNNWVRTLETSLAEELPQQMECRFTDRFGRQRPALLSIGVEPRADEQTWCVVTLADLTQIRADERRLREARDFLRRMAQHDSLTGLPNRTLFTDRLRSSLLRAGRYKHRAAVLFIDLDGFKKINDTRGHDAGDRVLTEVAARLRNLIRGEDTVARIGGDEFVVVLDNVSTKQAAVGVAQKIAEAVSKEIPHKDSALVISASVGVCVFPDDAASVPGLLKGADEAMYVAKAKGRNQVVPFAADTRRSRRQRLENDLPAAIANGELRLDYQPIFEAQSRQVTRAEALVRWAHPALGPLMPDEFVPLAEQSQQIDALGGWVLTEVCRQLQVWGAAGISIPIALNVSSLQLAEPDFEVEVRDVMARYEIEPSALEFELTESAVLKDETDATQRLAAFRARGIRLAVDDFGVGYSSLARLRQLPLSSLKVDRQFVDGIEHSQEDRAITRAIVAMGHELGLSIVAEGVETHEQLEFLMGIGCDYLQGFLLSRPVAPEFLQTLLVRQ